MPEAVVIAESERQGLDQGTGDFSPATSENSCTFRAGVELLGESVVGRLHQALDRAGMSRLSLIVDDKLDFGFNPDRKNEAYLTPNVWSAALQTLLNAKTRSVDAVLLARAGAYVDIDFANLLQFHMDSGEASTRVWDDDSGALDLWIVDPETFSESDNVLLRLQDDGALYRGRWYVNRLQNLHDVRRLVVDGLTGRCGFRPQAPEVRPGVWIGDGAEVKKGARVVAPAFIGRNVKIADQCLITRCSNIESDSHIDYGTVVEDSSVLSNTYVGIGLDLSHAIADGVILQNLSHDVTLEITDPVVMGSLGQARNRGVGTRNGMSDLHRTGIAVSSINGKS